MDPFDRLLSQMPAIAKAVNGFTSEEVQQQAFRATHQRDRWRGAARDERRRGRRGFAGRSEAAHPDAAARADQSSGCGDRCSGCGVHASAEGGKHRAVDR